jgi:hypothetical protein
MTNSEYKNAGGHASDLYANTNPSEFQRRAQQQHEQNPKNEMINQSAHVASPSIPPSSIVQQTASGHQSTGPAPPRSILAPQLQQKVAGPIYGPSMTANPSHLSPAVSSMNAPGLSFSVMHNLSSNTAAESAQVPSAAGGELRATQTPMLPSVLNEQAFISFWGQWLKQSGHTYDDSNLHWDGRQIKPYELYRLVTALGGVESVRSFQFSL